MPETMSKTAPRPPTAASYERDLYLWTQEQAELLRQRRFDELDLENLIDEVVGVGGSQRQEIESRLDILIAHLLKWKYQPGARSSSWQGTIREQRKRLARLLGASPSLRTYPAEVFGECYSSARLVAAEQTGMDFTLFPATPSFTLAQTLDERFLPKEPDLLDQS